MNINDNVYDQLTRVGAEILRNLHIRSKYHTCARVQYNEWKSTCPKDLYEDSNKLKIPQWKTVETVTVSSSNRLKCTCSYTKVYGFPCVHMISVSNTFPNNWSGISRNDISVFWWKIYYLFSLPEKIIDDVENQQRIKDILHTLLQKEDVGIKIPQDLYSTL